MLIPLLTKISHISKTVFDFLISLPNHQWTPSCYISLNFPVDPHTSVLGCPSKHALDTYHLKVHDYSEYV